MNFTLRFWICSSFRAQNETQEVKNHNLCPETEQNVPMNFYVKGTAEEPQIESLDEAASLQDISKMPARVKCAVLGWRTMKECFEKHSDSTTCSNPDCCTNQA